MKFIKWLFIVLFAIAVSPVKCRPENFKLFPRKDAEKTEENLPLTDRINKLLTEDDLGSDYFQENSSLYWTTRAQLTLRNQLMKKRNEKMAKNVIFFLGDGMSIATLTASRIYKGQKNGQKGEESKLSFEEFPYIGLSKTYCVDRQVADSACSATAYLCGVKGNIYTIGVNGRVKYNDCEAAKNSMNQVHSLAAWAQRAGKATGIVTTTTVTHASPAGTYAHVPNRNFESDGDVKNQGKEPTECEDIASQLIRNKPGNKFKVIFGGGRTKFLPNTENDVSGIAGERLDGINLIEEWKRGKKLASVVYDRDGLINASSSDSEYILGLFTPGHMSFNLDADRNKEPTLKEMTETAIKMLQKEKKGFFLFVEGGRIDHGHHEARAHKALDETVQFAETIRRAKELTNDDDTLIVVTSDHSHTMTISGYPLRGNDILKLNTHKSDIDNLPFTTLSYANGPGYKKVFYYENGTRNDLTGTKFDKDYVYPGTIPMSAETHGGDDVGVFASGCMSHLFSGVYEQNTIPHIVGYAACIGDGLTACDERFS